MCIKDEVIRVYVMKCICTCMRGEVITQQKLVGHVKLMWIASVAHIPVNYSYYQYVKHVTW